MASTEGEHPLIKRQRILSKSIKIIPMSCKRPSFRNQQVIERPGVVSIDKDNSILLIHSVLSPEVMSTYLEAAQQVERISSKSSYGHLKPRKEVCYTPTGAPYIYSGIAHPTLPYPPHVLTVLPYFEKAIDDLLSSSDRPPRPWRTSTSAVDICYDDSFERGGSISAHRDDEEEWGMVYIYSLGQTRYLRIRETSAEHDGRWINIKLIHNSLAVMYGPTLQKSYTHQIDKLSSGEFVGTRLSLNVRYL